ncbi:MAG TPA: glutamate 5-kinase [Aeromicrobium sp.]|nr:glutamate 5-kinase [Aeromicrobium sp.]
MSRIVVKIGSSSLTNATGGLDGDQVDALVDTIATARLQGDEVVLVSSGAIAAGLQPLRLRSRPRDLPTQQAAASVGQGLLVHRYTERFASHDIVAAQVLLTLDDVTRRSHYRNAYQTFARLLELGVVPIVNENDTVATSEIRFGDNDRLAALVAHLVHADRLVLLSDVDGLYDRHPGDDGAERIREVTDLDELTYVDVSRVGSAVGTGGMVTKLEAARLATEAGIPVTLTSADQAAAAIAGKQVGTRFTATGKRRSTRLLWLEHASDTKGALHVDAGAWRALSERNASLLPAGITSVFGSFVAGDPVDVINEDGAVVARGIVTYDSDELPGLLGRSTRELAAELGADYEREVIHRDDLVLLGRQPGSP